MSRTKEQRVWDSFKRGVPSGIWVQRIENVVGEGMPDVYVVSNGLSSWVELKASRRPVRASTPLLGSRGLNVQQINWHMKAASVGVRSFILIRDEARDLYLVSGMHAEEINSFSASQMREHSLASSWDEIFSVLEGTGEKE